MTTIQPTSPANERLLSHVHPPDWQNPTPYDKYNLVVIGGGSAGLIAAAGAAGLGARVALVERNLLGGDCLNVGCVPSKTLIRSAKLVGELRDAERYGVSVEPPTIDFPAIMKRVRTVRADISPHDSAQRYTKLGVDIFFGEARFTAPDMVEVAGKTLRFAKAVIATGSRPLVPPIDGLEESGYYTNETLFELTEQPERLAIIGAGPIGSELAQAFQRLGTQVTLFDILDQVLGREDQEAADLVQQALEADGVTIRLQSKVTRVSQEETQSVVHFQADGGEESVAVDAILLAVGRVPNVESLNLEAANVERQKRGLVVSDTLQTTNSNIYASGDVAVPYQFTHMADATSRVVLQNALFPGPNQKWTELVIPWVTYTDPEVAHVGRYPHELEEEGIQVTEWYVPLADTDRGKTDEVTMGFVKVHTKQGSDKILGATIVGPHAGELIAQIGLAMTNGVGLKGIGDTIYAYPTLSEAIKRVANEYTRSRFSSPLQTAAQWWFEVSR